MEKVEKELEQMMWSFTQKRSNAKMFSCFKEQAVFCSVYFYYESWDDFLFEGGHFKGSGNRYFR